MRNAASPPSDASSLALLKVLLLTRYASLGASSRVRFLQFTAAFSDFGIVVTASPLLSDCDLDHKYRTGGYGWPRLVRGYAKRMAVLLGHGRFDVVWIEKEALPWLPAWFELALLRRTPYVLDFDDAIFHNYDRHRSSSVRRLFGRRIDKLMSRARLVVAGNEYLRDRARAAGAKWVETVPTVVDLDRYPPPDAAGERAPGPIRVVWIGSPSTGQYLSLLAGPLAQLAARHEIVLHVIGAGPVELPGLTVKSLPWSAATEAGAIRACDIGVMPLFDSDWERGKCAYKLIQYMACGLPTVASAIGANVSVTVDGDTGFVVSGNAQWVAALERLICDPDLRHRLGQAGRQRVEQHYSLQSTALRLGAMLKQAGGG